MPPKVDNLLLTIDNKACRICNVEVVNPIFCPVCKAPYHPSCAKKTPYAENGGFLKCCGPSQSRSPSPTSDLMLSLSNEIKSLATQVSKGFKKNQDALSTLQNDIHDFGLRVTNVEQNLATVTERLDVVEIKVDEMQHSIPENSLSSEYLLSEWELRLKAKSNLIIFGFPEAIKDSHFDCDADKINFNKLLHFISPISPISLDNINLSRIGKFSVARLHPRPIKLYCKTIEKAQQIFEFFKKARNILQMNDNYKTIIIAQDRTKLQQNLYQDLKKTLLERRSKGKNLTIKYISGNPTIVSIPPTIVVTKEPTQPSTSA